MRGWLGRLALILSAMVGVSMPQFAAAHPGWGIVQDRAGNIYYTDLEQVWRVAPDGSRAIAVAGVHTHELYLDATGNLFGEHLWYEGEAVDRWGHRVWRRSPDGLVSDVIPATEGFRRGYSFVRDSAGNMYWQEDGIVRRRATDGRDAVVSPHRFGNIRSMVASPTGEVHLTDGGAIYRIGPRGVVRKLASNLGESTPTQPFVAEHHQLMGLWLDRGGNVYVAVFGGQKVKRIDPSGKVEVVARTTSPWSPTGGLAAADGSLWLLEYSLTNQARIRNASRPESGRPLLFVALSVAAALGMALVWVLAHRLRAN